MSSTTERPRVLLHVGFHKAGSSWLERWLRQHPQIRFAPGTFAGHRDPMDLCRTAAHEETGTRWLAMSEENWTGGLVFPEGYFYLLLRHQGFHRRAPGIAAHRDRLASELASLFPGARVLIITRGFAGALRSVYSQVVRIGGDLPFEAFLREYELQISEWLDYDRAIATYRGHFGHAQVSVVPFEALQEGEAGFMRLLEGELGLERAELSIGRVLPSLSRGQLQGYTTLSRRVLSPLARHLRNYRAMQMYMLYARYVVDRPWSDALVRRVFGRGGDATTLEVPSDYLERFRGTATSMAGLPAYEAYRSAYLLDGAAS